MGKGAILAVSVCRHGENRFGPGFPHTGCDTTGAQELVIPTDGRDLADVRPLSQPHPATCQTDPSATPSFVGLRSG